MYALYLLLSSSDEKGLIETIRRSASTKDKVQYICATTMHGIADLHYARMLRLDDPTGPMWKLTLHVLLTTLQSAEHDTVNIQDLRLKWTSVSHKKDEYIADFISKETARFEDYARALQDQGISPPSPYERLVSFTQRLQPYLKTLLGKHLRAKGSTLLDIDYNDVCKALIAMERSYYIVYEFESKNPPSKEHWAPVQEAHVVSVAGNPYKGKPKHDCPHCGKKAVRHPAELCYANPKNEAKSKSTLRVTNEVKDVNKELTRTSLPEQVGSQAVVLPQFMVLPSKSQSKEDCLRLHVPSVEVALQGSDNRPLIMGIDSFSEVSIIDNEVMRLAERSGLILETREAGERTCRAACGTLFAIGREVNLPVVLPTDHGPITAKIWCYVVSNFQYPHILLGASTLYRMKATIDMENYELQIHGLGGAKVKLSTSAPQIIPVAAAPSHELEDYLTALSDEDLYQWHEQRAVDIEVPKLSFDIKEGIPSSTRKYPIPARLREATHKELQRLARQGIIQIIKETDVTADCIVSPGFAKDKGRVDPETGLPAIRLLCDFSALNE
ncbi:hypothetical protein FOL47_002849, partial [Perkinsus chesapeaki]